MHEIDRSRVEHDQIDGASEQRLELCRHEKRLASKGGRGRRRIEQCDVHIAVSALLAASDAAIEVRGAKTRHEPL
jgi:hypothetical protein